ncbi:MAG: DNA polymerase III subunit delta [Firmicutes bacterium]|nr:DNA polymerase III subunit delta [Bacillota bacterium]
MDIIQQIKTKPLAKVYVVHGPDQYKQDQVYKALYERALEDGFGDWNWVTIEGHKELALSELTNELATAPWGGGQRIIAVSQGDQISTEVMNNLVKWLKANPAANSLALFFDKFDQRLKAIKELLTMGVAIPCETLTGEGLIRWIQDYLALRQKSIKVEVAELFLERVGNDLNLITNELEKLLLFIGSETTVTEQHVQEITSFVPGQLEQGAIFKMVEAISAKDQAQALDYLHQLIDAGEVPLRILPLIERQLRLLLAAKTRGNQSISAVTQAMGETSDFALKKALRYQNNFTLEELYQGFADIVQVDSELKFGADPEQIMEQLIIKLCA